MRAVVQRVTSARVSVGERTVSEIGEGMVVLLGVATGDGAEAAGRMADKLARLRIFEDADGRMNEAAGDREILCVSQFTLLADTRRGNRPGFGAGGGGGNGGALCETCRDRPGHPH
ncbi:MAG: D-aminoacyl-tRNA deacylase, partial [Solirubrobacterales bacterium]